MFKFKNKNLIEKNNAINPREIMTNFLVDNEKINFSKINQIVFKEIEKAKNKDDNNYININQKKFKYLLTTNQYVDYKYFSLQIYLLQDDLDEFKYWEIKQLLSKIIKILENILLEWKSISIANKIYITFSHQNKLKINNQFFPRLYIQKEKPKGPVFSIEDLGIDFNGAREISLYKLIVKNFDDLLIELLEQTNQVLLGDLLIIKMNFNYAIIPSGKFLFGPKTTRNLSETIALVQPKITEKSDLIKPKLRLNKSIYKTQQIFLGKINKKLINQKFSAKNKLSLLKRIKKDRKWSEKINFKKTNTKLNALKLEKEIDNINQNIKTKRINSRNKKKGNK